VLISVWSRRRTDLARRVMLAGLVVSPVLVVVQALVVTERERLRGVCEDLANAIRHVDLDTFEAHLTPDFTYRGVALGRLTGRETMRQRLEQTLLRYRVEEPRLRGFEMEVGRERAVVRFIAVCRVVSAEAIEPSLRSSWELTFRRVSDAWRLEAARNRDLRPGF